MSLECTSFGISLHVQYSRCTNEDKAGLLANCLLIICILMFIFIGFFAWHLPLLDDHEDVSGKHDIGLVASHSDRMRSIQGKEEEKAAADARDDITLFPLAEPGRIQLGSDWRL